MWCKDLIFITALAAILASSSALWSCVEDLDCIGWSGTVCRNGDCVCPAGKQHILGGTVCAPLAPYHTSPCKEDHQCSRMSLQFQCRIEEDNEEGICSCRPNHHYYLGRCWPTSGFGDQCTRDEECMSIRVDPDSMKCDGTCQCADDYYERQRGECRRAATAVGEGCVVNSDCQFEGGSCNQNTLSCVSSANRENQRTLSANNSTAGKIIDNKMAEFKMAALARATSAEHITECSADVPCENEFSECSTFGVCLCRVGYYGDGLECFAELGSPSTEAQCIGLLAEVRDGMCSCPNNFFYNENMRDCVRVSRRIEDSCVTDANCYTFGSAGVCGAPQPPWDARTCTCDPHLAVWDAAREMCRLFAGVGESCEVDSDCLAGELEILCLADEHGDKLCSCPEGYTLLDGLCLTLGLELGDTCQVSLECTGTPNTVCEGGRCSCDTTGYMEVDGECLPIIGGVCTEDQDCQVINTICFNNGTSSTCQCTDGFVNYENECWIESPSLLSECNVTAQCQPRLGPNSLCTDGVCMCEQHYHYRDGRCWPITDLFQPCSRTSQCFLGLRSERVVCRNSLCQCEFHYPFSEALNTCTSSATKLLSSFTIILSVLTKLLT